MNTATKLFAMGMVSLLPLSALAADAPKASSAPKPAASAAPAATELHGFDKYWSMLDPTGKGFISKEDWQAHATERFKEIDTNGDGKISKDEMKVYDDKMMQHRREMRAQYKKNKDQKDQKN